MMMMMMMMIRNLHVCVYKKNSRYNVLLYIVYTGKNSRRVSSRLTCVYLVFSILCISLCRKFLLVDPSEEEESVMEGKMVIGMNKHREICTLQMTGSMLLLKDQVMQHHRKIAIPMCTSG